MERLCWSWAVHVAGVTPVLAAIRDPMTLRSSRPCEPHAPNDEATSGWISSPFFFFPSRVEILKGRMTLHPCRGEPDEE